MTDTTVRAAHPVLPLRATRLRPIPAQLEGGLLAQWQQRNLEATVPHSIAKLHEYGHVSNLERLVTGERVPFAGHVFADSDLHKTMEGIAWTPVVDGEADAFFEQILEAYEGAQASDGYLNSAFQGWDAKQARWSDFPQGHELYALGHLIQAGIAAQRNGRGPRLLRVARRFADLAVGLFGGEGRPEVPGHPEIEMALVELFRETGHRPYLDLAKEFIERRGHRWLGAQPHGPYYYQDAVPFRQTTSLHGHAVRAAYLCAGAADVAIETRDADLLTHLEALWDDMTASKMFVTGGIGSRHRDESFGDGYELPSERAYAETCAAIGLIQWAWRMLLCTGRSKYAAFIEQALFNAFSVGLSAEGRAFFYSNPLQRRNDHLPSQEEGAGERLPWFAVSCCPPNIIRTMATLHSYLATQDDDGIQVHIPATATIQCDVAGGGVRLCIDGDYPWTAKFTVTVAETPSAEWTLRFRLPTGSTSVTIDGRPAVVEDGYVTTRRSWHGGDVVRIEAELPVRRLFAHPHVDALRGAQAVLRGPLVYCAEQIDNSADIDDFQIGPVTSAMIEHGDDAEVTISLPGTVTPPPSADLYSTEPPTSRGTPTVVRLVPYFTWGNRGPGAMRVWLPSERP